MREKKEDSSIEVFSVTPRTLQCVYANINQNRRGSFSAAAICVVLLI